jgi:RHS repeat-associated protein
VVELDPWGANTARSSATVFQPQNFTSYTRDLNGDQDAMARRYSVSGRFSQPDPYSGSYDFSDPQSLNRYTYVGNDPVNKRDSSGMDPALCMLDGSPINCSTAGMFVNSGAGVRGPLHTVRYDEALGSFVTFTAINAAGGTATGWVPHGYHFLGGLSWGFTDVDHPNSNGDPTSFTASLKYLDGLAWRNGQWELGLYGYWYNVYGDNVGVQRQGVETDWNAQLAIGGALNIARAGVGALIDAAASAAATETGSVFTVQSLIDAAGQLQPVKGGVQGFVRGDAQQIFDQITNGASRLPSGAFRLANGTYVRLYSSSTSGAASIAIKTAQQYYKIRVVP